MYTRWEELKKALQKSKFRKKFYLKETDKKYIDEKSIKEIESHAKQFLYNRIAPAYPKKDGKQTPWKGHPVFIAQHATATCCRSCIEKWHNIEKGRELTQKEFKYTKKVIILWIKEEMNKDG